MKKYLFVFYCLAFIVVAACSKKEEAKTGGAQENKSSGTTPASKSLFNTSGLPCPMGTHEVATFTFTTINFHRSKYNCEHGFGLCAKGYWSTTCAPNSPLAYLTDDESGFIWAKVADKDKALEIHLPQELKKSSAFARGELSTFGVDEDFEIVNGVFLKPGEYAVQDTGKELVVVVDVK